MFSEVPATEWSMFWNSPEMVLPEVRERAGLERLKASARMKGGGIPEWSALTISRP